MALWWLIGRAFASILDGWLVKFRLSVMTLKPANVFGPL